MALRKIPKLKSADLRGKVDVAILTMREDEEDAVLRRFPTAGYCDEADCSISYLKANGGVFTVAVTRCLRQGTNAAQKVAETVIGKLEPSWIVVVGIAGAVPDSEFTLGDVVIADCVYDLTLGAVKQGKVTYSLGGGSVHDRVTQILAGLRSRRVELQGWNHTRAIRSLRPEINVDDVRCYGPPDSQELVLDSLRKHFGGKARPPLFTVRPIVSSNLVVQDTELVEFWTTFLRHIAAIEMEFAGVYIAAKGRARDRGDVPVFTVRGLSDVVGLERQGDGDWRDYACNTAASFTRFLVARGFLGPPRIATPAPIAAAVAPAPVTAGAVPPENPFREAGTIPLDAACYIPRACDERLRELLAQEPLIYIKGGYAIGKSSLLERARRMLPERQPGDEGGWHFFISRRVANMEGKPGAFLSQFLRMFEPALGDVANWTTLQDRIKAQQSVILLDELGEAGADAVQTLIPGLVALAAEAPRAVRIVVTLPAEMGAFLNARGMNPKHAEPWKRIDVPPFFENEMDALLALLPARPRALAAGLRGTIKAHAAIGHSTAEGLAPKKLEILCSRLFEADQEGHPEAELAAIIGREESYR